MVFYRWVRHHQWMYSAVTRLGQLIGWLVTAFCIVAGLFALLSGKGNGLGPVAVLAPAAVIGLCLLLGANGRRRLQPTLAENQYAVEDSRLLQRMNTVGLFASWLGYLAIVGAAALLVLVLSGKTDPNAAYAILMAVFVGLMLWGFGAILRSCADPALGT